MCNCATLSPHYTYTQNKIRRALTVHAKSNLNLMICHSDPFATVTLLPPSTEVLTTPKVQGLFISITFWKCFRQTRNRVRQLPVHWPFRSSLQHKPCSSRPRSFAYDFRRSSNTPEPATCNQKETRGIWVLMRFLGQIMHATMKTRRRTKPASSKVDALLNSGKANLGKPSRNTRNENSLRTVKLNILLCTLQYIQEALLNEYFCMRLRSVWDYTEPASSELVRMRHLKYSYLQRKLIERWFRRPGHPLRKPYTRRCVKFPNCDATPVKQIAL